MTNNAKKASFIVFSDTPPKIMCSFIGVFIHNKKRLDKIEYLVMIKEMIESTRDKEKLKRLIGVLNQSRVPVQSIP